MKQDLAQNKSNAIAFYKMAYDGDPKQAVDRYTGDEYVQHNPAVGDGKLAFVMYFQAMRRQYPDRQIEFVRAIAEGDLVALHTHQIWQDNKRYVTMDFFRFDQHGKIIEHWDSVQEIPEMSKNSKSMY